MLVRASSGSGGGGGGNYVSDSITIATPVAVTLDFVPTKITCYAMGANGSLYIAWYDANTSFNTYCVRGSSSGSVYLYTDGISISGKTVTFSGFSGNLANYPLYYIATDE